MRELNESDIQDAVATKADEIILEFHRAHYAKFDRLFIWLLALQWLALPLVSYLVFKENRAFVLAEGKTRLYLPMLIGFIAIVCPIVLYRKRPGDFLTRHSIALAQMVLSGLLIHVSGGRIETHFHAFGSLAFLSFYRDWKVIVTGGIVVVLDHIIRELAFPWSIYGVDQTSGWRWSEHAWWIIFESAFLIYACLITRRDSYDMIEATTRQRVHMEEIQHLMDKRTAELIESKRESEHLAFVVRNTDDIVIMLDESGLIKWVNQAFMDAYKMSFDDAVQNWYKDLLMADEVDAQSLAMIETYIENKVTSTSALITVRNRKDEKCYIEQEFIVKPDDGTFVVIERDRTRMFNAQEQARISFEESKTVIDSITGAVIGVSYDWKVFRWNKHATELLGVKRHDAMGNDFRDLEYTCDKVALMNYIAAFKEKPYVNNTFEMRGGCDGEDCSDVFLFNVHEIRSGVNKRGFVLIALNVSDKKMLEQQLYHAQKMEAVGQLATGVAHEINTPIQFIGDNLRFFGDAFDDVLKLVNKCHSSIEFLNDDFKKEMEAAFEEADVEYLIDEIPQAVSQSIEGVARVAKIVRAMKDFSHPGENEKELTDLNDCVNGAVIMAKNEYKYCAELNLDLDDGLESIYCNKNEIIQVVLIMLVNAAHAVQDRNEREGRVQGHISIKTYVQDVQAVIEIADDGAGMPDSVKERIFEAFFTTKEVGRGTGQGLSLAHNIIYSNHGGSIDVVSEQTKGTTFIIKVPLKMNDVREGANA